MKAIIRIPTKKNRGGGEPAPSTYKRLHYNFLPVKKGAAREVSDRVLWIVGELDGYGFVVRDPRLMAEALECGHEELPGRRTRHIIMSVAAGLPEVQRADAFERLKASAPLLAKKLGARRWVATAHRDTDCPHLHMLIANFDEEKERRFDIRPMDLKKLQDFDWTQYFETGRGSRTQRKNKRGKALREAREVEEKGRWEKKTDAIQKLRNFLKEKKAPVMSKNELADWLMATELPSTWRKHKLKSTSGKHRSDPAIIIDGEGLKFGRFFASLDKKPPGWTPPAGAEINR
jgi:hypothetical protein